MKKIKLTVALAAVLTAGAAVAFDLGAAKDVKVDATGGELSQHAAAELVRLLGRAGVKAEMRVTNGIGEAVAVGQTKRCDLSGIRYDGFVKSADAQGVTIAAKSGKGVLNGVYTLAEELGFAFVRPGEAGERVPAKLKPVKDETRTVNPRFAHRGLFASSVCVTYTVEEWYHFLAKLRFNAICAHSDCVVPERTDLLHFLGFRVEAGGHGMSACLPRDRFEKEPELFRMFQPEDFGGKRMKDSNFCATNPNTRDIVKENFKKRVRPAVEAKIHAMHAWADDLPGGGWCMCSRCRAFSGTDQSTLAMNLEAEALRELGSDLRVPLIAYHDTMYPSSAFRPDPKCFLLFAPRERCYAHALNDPGCAHNRFYHGALKAYQKSFSGIDDAHTFEYYNDKILFRGHTPYLPKVILGDADAYVDGGITCWMSLQVGGELQGIDWNMLAHAAVAWEAGLTEETLTAKLAAAVDGANPAPWKAYLLQNASAYQVGWQVCCMPCDSYFDYRFMPERGGKDGEFLVNCLAYGAKTLRAAGEALRAAQTGCSAAFAAAEADRALFEATDLDAMVFQQRGMKYACDYLAGDKDAAKKAVVEFERTVTKLDEAVTAFDRTFVKNTRQYFPIFVRGWTRPEVVEKIRIYRQAYEKGAKNDLRVLYWNIQDGMWSGQADGYKAFVDYVKDKNPDVCIWAEAESLYRTGTDKPLAKDDRYLPDNWQQLAWRYGHAYVYLAAHPDDYPQVITAKYPIENVKRLKGTKENPIAHGAGWATVRVGGRKVNLVTFHAWPLKWKFDCWEPMEKRNASVAARGGDYQRRDEIAQLCEQTVLRRTCETGDLWLMAGDFNAVARSDNGYYKLPEDDPAFLLHDWIAARTPYVDIVKKFHPDAFVPTVFHDDKTYGYQGGKRIDFVYLTPELAKCAVSATVLKDAYARSERDANKAGSNLRHPSDHLPIVVDFDFAK